MSDSERKKVIYLIATLKIGGAEQQVVEVASRINRDMFEPQIYCLSEGGPLQPVAEQHGVKVTVFQAGVRKTAHSTGIPLRRPREFFSLYRYLQQERPDIVHCYMYKPSIYGGLATRLLKKPILLTNRRRLGVFKDGKPHLQFLENVVNRFTDGVLVNSQALKEDVLRRERHLSPDNVHVIHNGVDTQKYCMKEESRTVSSSCLAQRKQAFGIPVKAPVIGMIANLFPYKGHHDLIRAAAKVHQAYPDARFLCIGEDWGIQGQLETLCSRLGLQDHFLFTGHIQNIAEMLHVIDIQVSASHEEGFSNAILEGMATGKPIVATSVGGTLDVIIDRQTGLLAPPKNPDALATAITILLDTPDFASKLGRNAKKLIEEHFSMEKMLDKLEKLYLKFLSL